MGIVFKAYEESLNRTVALKILRTDLADDPVAGEAFHARGEGRRHTPTSKHRNGPRRWRGENGAYYLAMEYVAGPTLAQVIRDRGALPVERTRAIFRQILLGLEAAHEAGLIHRDIKSSNVLLSEDEEHAKIADFGLALISSTQTRLTVGDSVLGTPEYMSPEQTRGEESLDHRTDLYSAGVVLYEMLTGRTPFKADSPSAVIHRIQNDAPLDPRRAPIPADTPLASLAIRLMAKLPEDRLPSASDIMAALESGRPVRSCRSRKTHAPALAGHHVRARSASGGGLGDRQLRGAVLASP